MALTDTIGRTRKRSCTISKNVDRNNKELIDLSVAAEGVVLALEEALRHLRQDEGFRVWGFVFVVCGV